MKMAFKKLLYSKWVIFSLLVTWVASLGLVVFMISNLNMIVHGTLYDYGLQFSSLWAEPYWMYLDLIYLFLGVASALAFSAIAIGFYKSRRIMVESEGISKKTIIPKISKQSKIKGKKQPSKSKVLNGNEDMVISCPSCSKVFGRPLVMLNFEGGKTRLVNVCPYCNHGLDQITDNATSDSQFHVRGLDEIKKIKG